MLLSVLVFPQTGFAESKNIVASESFNDIVTATTPMKNSTGVGQALVKVTEEGEEKGLELSNSKVASSIYLKNPSVDKTISFYADLKYTGGWTATTFFIRNSANKQYTLASCNEKGELISANNQRITVLPKERDTNIQLTYDTQYKRLTVYVDGKCVLRARFLNTSAHTDVSGFGIAADSKTGKSFIVDNLAIFEGTAMLKSSDVPKAGYVAESAEVVVDTENSGDEQEYVSDSVYITRSFEDSSFPYFDKWRGLLAIENKGSIKVEKSLFEENHYAKIEKTEASKSYIQLSNLHRFARYQMFEVDVSTESNTPAGYILQSYDSGSANVYNAFLNVTKDGAIKTHTGVEIAKVRPMEWTRIGVFVNLEDRYFDVYANGELKAENIPFKNTELIGFSVFRIGTDEYANTGTLLVDNIKVYEGKTFRQVPPDVRATRPVKDSVARGYINTDKAVNPYSSTYYSNLEKKTAEHKMILEDNDQTCYMHIDDLKGLFGENVKPDGAHSTEQDYYNLSMTAKATGYPETRVDTRFYMFSKGGIDLTEDQLETIIAYLFFERPSTEQIKADFSKVTNENQRPRVGMNSDDLAKIRAGYKTDPYLIKWSNNVFEDAEAALKKARFNYDKIKTDMTSSRASFDDLSTLALTYLLIGGQQYLDKAWEILYDICLLDYFGKENCLCAGEFTYTLAVGYDWLYDYWTEEQKEILVKNIYEKGIMNGMDMYYNQLEESVDMYTEWWNSSNNFLPVINGGWIAGSLAIMDTHPDPSAELISLCLVAIENHIKAYYPAGAWTEGSGYWRYSLHFLSRMVTTMENSLGSSYSLMNYPGLDKTGWFGTSTGGSTTSFGFGDAGGGGFVNNKALQYLATRYNDKELMAVRFNEYDVYGIRGDWEDMIYYNPELRDSDVEVALDTYVEGMETVVLREKWYDTGSTSVATSGGNNIRGHGHMDIGSFQIDMAGERFVQDLGAENYNAKGGYFNTGRYFFYATRPEGHNLYIINPEDSLEYFGQEKNAVATGEIKVSKPKGAIATMDLDEAYAPWATSAKRGYMLSDNRRSVTIRDEIDLIKPDSEIYWFAHTKADIEIIDSKTALFTLNGKKVLATVETNAASTELKVMEPESISPCTKEQVGNTDYSAKNIRKLAVVCKASGKLNITVKFKQYDDSMIDPEPTKLSIDEWTIPDGEVIPLPEVDAIYINGKLVDKFDGSVTGYSYMMPVTATAPFQVSVDTNLKYELTQAPAIGGDAIIKVYSDIDSSVYRTYRVNFWQREPLGDVDGMRRYPVLAGTSSENATENNIPDSANDGDFKTWWSALAADKDVGQWLMFELDDVFPVEKIGIAWYNGETRVGKYKLEISEDGVNWTTIYNGDTLSYKGNQPEYKDVGGRNVKYVKVTGYGTTVNQFVMISELQVLGNKR